MKIPILTLDMPNLNNRIYPKEVMEKAIAKYKKDFVDEKRALVTKRIPESETVDLTDVIGVVRSIGIEEGKVVVDVDFLPELKDAILCEAGVNSGILHFRTAGVGSMHLQPDGTYKVGDDYEILTCFITNKPA